MPRVLVTHGAGNVNIATLLGAQTPLSGWMVSGTYQADSDNTGVLLLGSSAMTATDYDVELSAGDSVDDAGIATMLKTRYVRNDHATDDQYLIIRGEGS